MSRWGEISATFTGKMLSVNTIKHEFAAREAPTGSEDGPMVGQHADGEIYVEGRLRDVTDTATSFEVLAWFTRTCYFADRATLTWEIDDGPRYRYIYEGGELTKLKGVLDQ